ncbi:MAG: HD domain-containing protein [Nanoarchaeota archaeon]
MKMRKDERVFLDDIVENQRVITALLKEVDRKGVDGLVGWLRDSDYFTAPASTMFHGNVEGGLAAHSLAVYRQFDRRVEEYGFQIPPESVIVAGLLHDACKIDYYGTNTLKSGNVSDAKPYKANDAFPIGHGEKSVAMIQRYMPLTEQEAVIIRWHMGPYDPAWSDYEDKVEKLYPEAVVFHHVDKEVSLIYKV